MENNLISNYLKILISTKTVEGGGGKRKHEHYNSKTAFTEFRGAIVKHQFIIIIRGQHEDKAIKIATIVELSTVWEVVIKT